MSIQHNKALVWAFCFFLVVLTYGMTASFFPAHAKLTFSCETKEMAQGEAFINLRGGFSHNDDKVFLQDVLKCRQRHKVSRVNLTSGGGDLDAGIKISYHMRKLGLHSHIPPGSECASSCTIAFLGGVRRTVDEDGKYIVHGFFGSAQAKKSITYLKTTHQELKKKLDAVGQKKEEEFIAGLNKFLKPDFVEIERSTVQFSRRIMKLLQQNNITLNLLDSIFSPPSSRTPDKTNTRLSITCSPSSPTKNPKGAADFSLVGVIHENDPRAFKQALHDCLKSHTFIAKITLNSPGGDIDAALEIADLIKKHGLASFVPKGAHCEGSCGLLYLASFPRKGKTIDMGTQWLGSTGRASNGKDYLLVNTGEAKGLIWNRTTKLDLQTVPSSCMKLHPVVQDGENFKIMGYKKCLPLNKEGLLESTPFEGGNLNGLSQHYYQASDGYDPTISQEHQPLSIQVAFKILGYIESNFPMFLKLKKANPQKFSQILSRLAQHESQKITDMQNGSASMARRLFNLLRSSRVSSRFIDHMFATGITGLRPLTPEELYELAITTGS